MAAQNLNHLEEQSELIKMFDKDKRRSIWDNVIIIVKKGRGDQDDIQVVKHVYSFYLKNEFYLPHSQRQIIFPIFIPITRQGALKAARSREQGRNDKVANIQSLGYTLGGPHGITNEEARRKIERAVLKIKDPVRNAAIQHPDQIQFHLRCGSFSWMRFARTVVREVTRGCWTSATRRLRSGSGST